MYTTLKFAAPEGRERRNETFPAALLSFLRARRVFVAREDNGDECLWQSTNLSAEVALSQATRALDAWRTRDLDTVVTLHLEYEEGSLANQLYQSLLKTVGPSIHDCWSPWDCSVRFGPQVISSQYALYWDKKEIATTVPVDAPVIPGYPREGDVIGNYALCLGTSIDEDGERLVTTASTSITFGAAGSPARVVHFLASAADDPVLRRLLAWLRDATEVEWTSHLVLT